MGYHNILLHDLLFHLISCRQLSMPIKCSTTYPLLVNAYKDVLYLTNPFRWTLNILGRFILLYGTKTPNPTRHFKI